MRALQEGVALWGCTVGDHSAGLSELGFAALQRLYGAGPSATVFCVEHGSVSAFASFAPMWEGCFLWVVLEGVCAGVFKDFSLTLDSSLKSLTLRSLG